MGGRMGFGGGKSFGFGGMGGFGGKGGMGGGGATVFVRGFDFGTTEQQLRAYLGMAGKILKVNVVGQGEAEVTYRTSAEAEAALGLDKSVIPGNSRFIDVIVAGQGGKGGFKGKKGGKGGGANDPPGSGRVFVRGFDFGTTEEQLKAYLGMFGRILKVDWRGKGEAEVVFQTSAEAAAALTLDKSVMPGNSRFIDVTTAGGGGAGFGGGGNDPPGSGRIFVRGFDFGTSEEELVSHLSSVGTIMKLKWAGKGEAEVVYSTQAEAAAAMSLNKSRIAGNTRFIDVIPKESE